MTQDGRPKHGFLSMFLIKSVNCALGLRDDILSSDDVTLLYKHVAGRLSRDHAHGAGAGSASRGKDREEVCAQEKADTEQEEEKEEEETMLDTKHSPQINDKDGHKLDEDSQDEVDGALPPSDLPVAPYATVAPDDRTRAGQAGIGWQSDLVTDGPSDSSSDEEGPTVTVGQSYPNMNGGGVTKIYVNKMVLADGTTVQVGNNVINYMSEKQTEEESSSESSGESSDLDSSIEVDPLPAEPRPQRRDPVSTPRTPTQNSTLAPPVVQQWSSTLTQESVFNGISRPSPGADDKRADAHDSKQTQPSPCVSGKGPLGGAVVHDIVDDEGEEEDPLPVTNMFVDVDEDMFVGREKEFQHLEDQLLKKKVAGISGIGGSGKTTFSSLYAYRNMKRYRNGMYFVDASNINTLPLNFAQLAGPELLNLVRHPDKDIATSIKLVSAWFEKSRDYLLIFDAADGLRTMEELGKQRPLDNIRYIPPRRSIKGHVIITSRLPTQKFDLVQISKPVHLGDLGMSETCEFLKRRVYDVPEIGMEERAALETLIKEFLPGRLPLNLEQTASYIRRQLRTFAEYLTEVRSRKERNPIDTPTYGDNRKTVDEAFIANFDAVKEESKEAAALLNMAAVCHSRNIPYSLFIVGAMALTHADVAVRGDIGELIEYFTDNPSSLEPGQPGFFTEVSSEGKLDILRLLAIPEESQLVKYTRGADEFTVHEVIQEQLQERMVKQKNMVPTLTTLANILLFMLKSDDLSLANKRLFLAHAEKCAENMVRYGPAEDGPTTYKETDDESNEDLDQAEDDMPFSHLYLRLRIRTAFAFAWLGSFPIAWEIIRKLEKKMPQEGSEQLRVELLSLKARICVWEHRPADALRYGRQGLRLVEGGQQLNSNHINELIEYAFLRKSCAHALITQYETGADDIVEHLSEAKRVFEIIMETSSTNCREEYAHLLMLHGLLHRNTAERCPRNDQARRMAEFQLAQSWLRNARDAMDTTNYLIETCKVHLCMVEVELNLKSKRETVSSLMTCRKALDVKLGSHHRYTAWVLDKIARLLVDIGDFQTALEKAQESLQIQETVYGQDSGRVQMGQTRFFEGQALFRLRCFKMAADSLEEAERLLEATPKNPAYTKVRELLREVRQAIMQEEPELPDHTASMNGNTYSSAYGDHSTLTDKYTLSTSQYEHMQSRAVLSDWNQNNMALRSEAQFTRKPTTHDEFACPSLGQRRCNASLNKSMAEGMDGLSLSRQFQL